MSDVNVLITLCVHCTIYVHTHCMQLSGNEITLFAPEYGKRFVKSHVFGTVDSHSSCSKSLHCLHTTNNKCTPYTYISQKMRGNSLVQSTKLKTP